MCSQLASLLAVSSPATAVNRVALRVVTGHQASGPSSSISQRCTDAFFCASSLKTNYTTCELGCSRLFTQLCALWLLVIISIFYSFNVSQDEELDLSVAFQKHIKINIMANNNNNAYKYENKTQVDKYHRFPWKYTLISISMMFRSCSFFALTPSFAAS